VLSRTWDRFELPRPFSRVVVALGAPIDAVAASSPDVLCAAIERARAAAEETLHNKPRPKRALGASAAHDQPRPKDTTTPELR
jgi:hypothetical protein